MAETRAVLVTGATGLVGSRIVAALLARGDSVRVLSRYPEAAASRLDPRVSAIGWDGVRPPPAAVDDCEGVLHLAGEPVFGGLPTAARRRRIYHSRVDSTQALVQAIGDLPPTDRPCSFVCASAVGFYGDRGDERLDEDAPAGAGFLAEVCRDWEGAAFEAQSFGVRVAQLRIGIVLAREGGALPRLALPFRFGAGGRVGSGRQWVPWIHIDDLVALFLAALDDEDLRGPINAVAPEPVRNAELTRVLGRVLKRPSLLPVPGFALRAVLGELAGELLGSRRVVPARALAHGFTFAHADLEPALVRELR
ncbi:MAG: TIGR01777 family oxidoreductase [Deltaproteobacteria bacterium]|nr:TIGR01777 family oxidoreductase [Deltaproteobacteria bacterium]